MKGLIALSHVSSTASRPSTRLVIRRNLHSGNSGEKNFIKKFWNWTTQPRPYWTKDKKEFIFACTIFGITGTTSAFVLRPVISDVFGIKGSLVDGPNSYRVLSVLCLSPVYACMLALIGTAAGRHRFFTQMAMKILGRFMPKKVLAKVVCPPARQKFLESSTPSPKN